MNMEDNAESYGIDITVKKPTWSDDKDNNIPSLKKLLKPFLFSMALAGCYNFSDFDKNAPRKTSVKSLMAYMYRVVILLLVLLHLLKVAAAFFYLPKSEFMFNGLIACWLLSLIATYFVNLKATSSKYGHLEKAFVFWEEKIVPEFHDMDIKFPKMRMKKKTRIALVTSWLIVLGNVISIGMQMYLSGPEVLTSPFTGNLLMIVGIITLAIVDYALWIVPVVYICMMNDIVLEAFKAFNESFGKYCAKQGCKMPDNFQRVRLLHMKLCQLVTEVDEDIGWYYAATITFSVGMAVFTLYQILETSLTTFELVIFLFWMCAMIVICLLLASKAAFVNDAAHAPLDRIYYINVTDITVEKLAQLNLFLSKLTGSEVGFTACGLIVITKEFILTIAGLLLTYFAVLYTL